MVNPKKIDYSAVSYTKVSIDNQLLQYMYSASIYVLVTVSILYYLLIHKMFNIQCCIFYKTAPSLPQQGNNPAHSSASTLVSQQQSQQPDSTLVQASSLSSDDQSSTGDSQTSAQSCTVQL